MIEMIPVAYHTWSHCISPTL